MPETVSISGAGLTIAELVAIARDGASVELPADARARIRAAREVVASAVRENRRVYGVTTGFGSLSDVAIPQADARALQKNLLRSHACGVGEPLARDVVRATLALKLNALARGTSGVREEIADAILGFLENDVVPVVPSQGSVGASGDLAPLAHLFLPLIAEGEVWKGGRRQPAAEVMRGGGQAIIALEPIEGLALINGTQVMTAIAALALHGARRLFGSAQVAAALSIDALRGSVAPFRDEFRRARPHPGAAAVAANLSRLLDGSAINLSHKDCAKLQDAYSLRTTAAVLGAGIEALGYAGGVVACEMNADTGNPLVVAETGEILSGGNFHGEPVAIACDLVAIALAEAASISERRVNRLVDPHLSDLPAFLTEHAGLRSGMMIAQYTAAALVSENKTLAHPASVDSIPTSAEKEDHVSMGTIAARKAAAVLSNAERVVAIELLCAAQGIDFLRPLRTTEALEAAHGAIRAVSPRLDEDRPLAPDIEAVAGLVREGRVVEAAQAAAGPLEWPRGNGSDPHGAAW